MNSNLGYKGVLFDLDGTLINTYELILGSMRYVTRDYLHHEYTDRELMQYVGTPLDTQMVTFAGGNKELGAELCRIYRAHNEAAHDSMVKPYDDIPEVLERLYELKIPMAVVTGKRHKLACRGLEVTGLANYMQFVLGPDDFPLHKPDPGPVIEACKRLDLDPADCLYVGDSPYDMRAGVDAGCKAVACLWGFFQEDELRAQVPAFVIDTPKQLLALQEAQ